MPISECILAVDRNGQAVLIEVGQQRHGRDFVLVVIGKDGSAAYRAWAQNLAYACLEPNGRLIEV
jgi:hypothetical protein